MSDREQLVGKTVADVYHAVDDQLEIYFTDGSMLYAQGHWTQDQSNYTAVALLSAEDLEERDTEGRGFIDLCFRREDEWKESFK